MIAYVPVGAVLGLMIKAYFVPAVTVIGLAKVTL
jgi:hypothetical protein